MSKVIIQTIGESLVHSMEYEGEVYVRTSDDCGILWYPDTLQGIPEFEIEDDTIYGELESAFQEQFAIEQEPYDVMTFLDSKRGQEILNKVMNLGMELRQDQLNGSSTLSGNEMLSGYLDALREDTKAEIAKNNGFTPKLDVTVKNKTHEEYLNLLEETVAYYSENTTKKRAVDDGGECVYKDEYGRMCAVGRCLDQDVMRYDGYNADTPVDDLVSSLTDKVFKQKYQGFDIKFWRALQNLHDTEAYWNDNGLSSLGVAEFDEIKYNVNNNMFHKQ